MLPRIDLRDLVELHKDKEPTQTMLINLRGCNGSGKSTIPLAMKESDPYAFELMWRSDGKDRVVATVFPSYQFLALGKYSTACGGMDSLKTTDDVKMALEAVWSLNYNILMEGILASTVRKTYIELFKNMNSEHKFQREIVIFNLLPPLQVCLDRIQVRNGGKPIKEQLVENKWKIVEGNVKHFEAAGFKCFKVSNEGITREDTLKWFFDILKSPEPKDTPVAANQDTKFSTLYMPPQSEIEKYAFKQFYKQPNNVVVVNWENMRLFWYWMYERLKIWHKRVVLQQSAPWTNDDILREYKFTNVIRDLDRGTIVYLQNILKRIDDPGVDLVQRKKEIILNTMIYRMFILKETWDCIGFLTFDNWDKEWETAKARLRARRKSGQQMFHGAYMVNSYKNIQPYPNCTDKVEKVIHMVESCWKPNIDQIYEKVITLPMKDLLVYLSSLMGVGSFMAYEYVCDWAMCHRHTKNIIVPWDDDSYVNVGPGNMKGLKLIFENFGNLSAVELDMYLRASWKHFMKKYGFFDDFVNMLPFWMKGDINLRVIEHDLCEFSKYMAVMLDRPSKILKFAYKPDKGMLNLQ